MSCIPHILRTNKTAFIIAGVLLPALLAVKLWTAIIYNGPILFFDELLYKQNALYMLKGQYANAHYPPLYSIFLLPAFLAGPRFYLWMKVINVFISMFTAWPAFLLARRFLSKEKSVFIALLFHSVLRAGLATAVSLGS
ncbi:MAG: hypothetical protein PHP44_00500 [Kiritimatiellae bacterium]|nr:hypothetical protein [Kiritimatiellia bacterium]